MKKYLSFLQSEGITLDTNLIKKYKIEDCKMVNGILFYVGFSNELWNITYSETHALGGSENAVIYLAKELSRQYPIFITGDVCEETVEQPGNRIIFGFYV